MRIQKGNIVYFHYGRYHRDRNPLAVVLYADDNIVHCINLHYLSLAMTDEMIEAIAKIIGGLLDGKNTYKLYHNYLKRKLPHIIKKAYRTYKPDYIKHSVLISKGFDLNVFSKIRQKFSPEKIKKVEVRLKKEITIPDKEPEQLKIEKYNSIYNIDDYISSIKNIIKPKINISKYTGIKRK